MKEKIIIDRKSRRSLMLKILPTGEIFVSAPLNSSESEIEKFVDNHKNWIQKNIKKINEQNEIASYFSEDMFYILGNRVFPWIVNEKFEFLSDINKFTDVKLIKKSKLYWQQLASDYIIKIGTKISEQTNLKFKSITASKSKRSWGVCNSKKEIKINYKLFMLNEIYLKYVIIHELCHLKHLNHSKIFWNEVEKYLPNYKEIKKALSQFSFLLK